MSGRHAPTVGPCGDALSAGLELWRVPLGGAGVGTGPISIGAGGHVYVASDDGENSEVFNLSFTGDELA